MKIAAVLALTVASACASAQVLTSAFTYQGEVRESNSPATGTFDMRFRLYDQAGTPLGATLCVDNITVADGRFTVALDFGSIFVGQRRYLEIEVRRDTGLSCANATGFVVLSPRQELTATPHASFAMNSNTLGGLSSSFYTNAGNLSTGTLADARLAATVARTNVSQTFTGATTFSNAGNSFTGSGSGLTGLNAASLATGTIPDARLSSNVARLDLANTFTQSNFFSGNVGIGTSSPGERLEVAGGDGTVRVRNTNDPGGAFVMNSFATLQLGLYNPTAGAWGVIQANTKRSMLGLENSGRVGTMTNTSGQPVWRNILDDGSGAADFVGNVDAGSFTTSGTIGANNASVIGGVILGQHTGTLNSHYGVYGLASNTGASSAIGVRGDARGQSGRGMYGFASNTTGVTYGVLGLGFSSTAESAGVYGENTNTNGVYGVSILGRGVYGRSSSGDGVRAITATGGTALYAERTSNGNKGWFGGVGEGGWAESVSGTGFVAKSLNGPYALYAERNPGGTPSNVNRGWFGGNGEGAWAESDQGNGLVALTRSSSAAAVYCRNDGNGRALFADGIAAVRALDILGGADLAEPFDVTDAAEVKAGMVMSIDPENAGRLMVSNTAYDTKVAGIVSGANGLSAGMVMRDAGNRHADGTHPIAMTGRVWCYADATEGEITPGDRLTTSATPGHAMRVGDDARAPGSVIGKAMTGLPKGEKGLVLVLVNLH